MMDTRPARGEGPRVRWMGWWAAVSAVATVAAFAVGTQVRSPWSDAVRNAGTPATATVAVEEREFVDAAVAVTGVVRAGTPVSVVPVVADGRAVVTAAVASPGDVVDPGGVVVEVSGRPLIALPLPFALYDDLAPGDSGPGVRAVQESLQQLGRYSGPVDGVYGPGTSAAVRALYEAAGAVAPATSADLAAAVDEARSGVDRAQADVDAARRQLDRDRAAQTGADDRASATAAAQGAVDDARRALVTAQRLLSEAQAAADTPLPAAEVVAVGAGPVTCMWVAGVGTVLDDADAPGEAARLSFGETSVQARVTVAEAPELPVGTRVSVASALDAAAVAGGVVRQVGEFAPASDLGDLPGYDVEIALEDPGAAPFDDADAVLVSPAEEHESQRGLGVPLVAVRSQGDQLYVLRRDEAADEPRRVDITVRTDSDGWVLVDEGPLRAGDRLVIEVGG